MSQRPKIVDRFGQPLGQAQEKALTREQLLQILGQIRAELDAMHEYNAILVAVLEDKLIGFRGAFSEALKAYMDRRGIKGPEEKPV